jgi:GntR family transcriptional repressor for pyruvate dehydrogenase complex
MQDSIVDQAAEAIRQYVFSNHLTAGNRLPSERDLADALGTSRPALREAIGRLSAERVVEVRGRSGIYIASINVDEVFAVRLQLEPLAAELTANNRSAADLHELELTLDELREQLAEPAAFNGVDRRLHAVVARVSGNDVLTQLILQLSDLTLISRGLTARRVETRQSTLEDMEDLVAAISKQNGTAASHAMRVHLERVRSAAAGIEAQPTLPTRLAARAAAPR